MLESIRPEVERVQNLLTDTVTLLCKNGLTYDREMKVQGLLGITLDEKDCFVVHINELFSQAGAVLENVTVTGVAEGNVSLEDESSQSLSNDQMPPPPQQQTTHKKHRSSKRSHSATSDNVKVEKSDDVMIIEAKSEPGYDHGGGGGPTLAKRSRLMEQQQQENPAFTSPPQLPGGPYMAGLIAAQHQAGDGGSAGNSWDGQTNTSLALPGMNTLTSVTGNNAMLDQAAAVSWGDPNRSLGGNQLNTADSIGQQISRSPKSTSHRNHQEPRIWDLPTESTCMLESAASQKVLNIKPLYPINTKAVLEIKPLDSVIMDAVEMQRGGTPYEGRIESDPECVIVDSDCDMNPLIVLSPLEIENDSHVSQTVSVTQSTVSVPKMTSPNTTIATKKSMSKSCSSDDPRGKVHKLLQKAAKITARSPSEGALRMSNLQASMGSREDDSTRQKVLELLKTARQEIASQQRGVGPKDYCKK